MLNERSGLLGVIVVAVGLAYVGFISSMVVICFSDGIPVFRSLVSLLSERIIVIDLYI